MDTIFCCSLYFVSQENVAHYGELSFLVSATFSPSLTSLLGVVVNSPAGRGETLTRALVNKGLRLFHLKIIF